MRARAALRMRWRGWLGLALLLGIAGGFVASAAAGARRTASVYERLLVASAAFDLAVTERWSWPTSVEASERRQTLTGDPTRRAATFAGSGQRTSVAQPRRSKSRMSPAELSS